MDDVVYRCDGLTEGDIAFLQKMECDLGILADISRSDVLMYAPLSSDQAAVIGGMVAPLVIRLRNADVRKISDAVYYPVSLAVSAMCWVAVFAI